MIRKVKDGERKFGDKKQGREEDEAYASSFPQLMLLSARGFLKNHTHKHTVLACSPHIYTYAHKRTQVGQRSVVCQFVVPLVPSQEAHRQASSHAKTGTSPANTHINLRGYYTVAAGTAVSGFCMCVCPCVYLCLCLFASASLHFHTPQESNAEELGACERHRSPFHTHGRCN